jgi:hypothetical protein
MDTPTRAEFTDLYSICPHGCLGFPPELLSNQGRFHAALQALSAGRLQALWQLLKTIRSVQLVVYYTGTNDDNGFRVGVRRRGDTRAERVLARFYFPAGQEPRFDINNNVSSVLAGFSLPAAEATNLFDGDGLSAAGGALAVELLRLSPRGDSIIQRFVSNNPAQPYNHGAAKRAMILYLPASHPTGGLAVQRRAQACVAYWQAEHQFPGNCTAITANANRL